MSDLIKIYPKDYERVLPLLHQFENSTITDGQWKSLFENRWNHEEGIVGYGLENNGRIVGFIGLIFAKRIIRDEEITFCNISSWIVEKEFRHESLLLTKPLLKMKDYVITSFTTIPDAYTVWKRFGFKDLGQNSKIYFPLPFFYYKLSAKKNNSIDTSLLTKSQKKILDDNIGDYISFMNFTNTNDSCMIAYKIKYIRNLPVAYIAFISNVEFLKKCIHEIIFKICFKNRVIGVYFEEFYCEGLEYSLTYNTSRPCPNVYKSDKLLPRDIDFLYSEFVLWQ